MEAVVGAMILQLGTQVDGVQAAVPMEAGDLVAAAAAAEVAAGDATIAAEMATCRVNALNQRCE